MIGTFRLLPMSVTKSFLPGECMNFNASYVHDPHPATCAFNDESLEMNCYYSGTPSELT